MPCTQVGYVQTEMKKTKLCEYFCAVNRVSADIPDTRESAEFIQNSVWPKVQSAEALFENFAAAAAAGAGEQTTEEQPGVGLSERIQPAFAEWVETLSDVPAAFAEMLARVSMGEFDREIIMMAQRDHDGSPIQFYDYFRGMDVTQSDLQLAYADYNSASKAKPVSLACVTGCATAPREHSDVLREADTCVSDLERDSIWKKVCEMRGKQVKFFAVSSSTAVDKKWNNAIALGAPASAVGDKKNKKKHVKAWMVSSDLLVSQACLANIKHRKHANKKEWR